jgi:hypothetical protein
MDAEKAADLEAEEGDVEGHGESARVEHHGDEARRWRHGAHPDAALDIEVREWTAEDDQQSVPGRRFVRCPLFA